jgi:tight adherence protein B
VALEPGLFDQSWVIWLGVAALFFALAVSIGIAMMRSDRPSQLASRSVRRAGRSGTFQQLTQSASGIAERSLDRSGKRRGLERALEHAGVDMRPGEFLVIVATVAFAVFALGLLLGGIIVAAVLAAVVVFGTRLFVAQMADRRQAKFGDQLEQTLPLMAGSLRAGFGLMQALDAVARDMESPTSDEFRRLVSETRLGRDLDAGLDALSERMGGGDVEWVVQAIQIHRQVGGDLAEVLDNVQSTIRDRNQLRRRVKALSGEGRLSAVILLALPVVMFAWIALANPKYLHELTGNGLGIAMLVGAASMMLLGAAWMRRIIRLVF